MSIATSMVAPIAPMTMAAKMIAFKSMGLVSLSSETYSVSSSRYPVSFIRWSMITDRMPATITPPAQPRAAQTLFLLGPLTSARVIAMVYRQVTMAVM